MYNEKIYINDLHCSENLDEIDMNGEKTRTISLGKDRDKEDIIHLQEIMDGKVYFLQSNNNCSVLKSKELKTGEEKKVLQYEQPAYDKRKLEYASFYFRTSGNNLFIIDEFYIKNKDEKYWYEKVEPRYILYWLPMKNGGKIKRMLKQKIVDCDFSGEEIFYIDAKHLLHRKNLKKGTDKIISKRKLEKVRCIKEGIFVSKYKEGEAYDEDAVEEDVIYYMDFDGEHHKKIAEI